jgi:lysophospholipase L1-like esterase
LILLVAGLELLFYYWLKNPARIPTSMFPAFKEYYIHNYRNIVQVEKTCSEYDSLFFYRLRANNECKFYNVEFSNTITSNSLGLRDDAASLVQPSVICIGDSYTMGWGVEQEETFASKLEEGTGLKVLNAGMSSFGTVRELRQLARLDTSNCKWVVLQYCDNDVAEIKPYIDSNYRLQTSSATAYDTLVRRSEWNHTYYPGKTFFSVGMYWVKGTIKGVVRKEGEYKIPLSATQAVTIPESAKLFADVLRHSAPLFRNRSLIVLYAYEGGRKDEVFIPALQQVLSTSPYKEELSGPVYLLNTSTILSSEDNFLLDDHYNAKGHKKIAAAIQKIIQP